MVGYVLILQYSGLMKDCTQLHSIRTVKDIKSSLEFRYSFSILGFPLKTFASAGFNEFCSKKNKFNWKVYLGDDGVVHSATQVVIPSVDGRARLGWPGQITSLCHVHRRFLLYKIATNEYYKSLPQHQIKCRHQKDGACSRVELQKDMQPHYY
jgi:hypothetical protein